MRKLHGKKMVYSSLAVAMLIFGGCSSSSGGGGSASSTLSGTAVDDLILNGVVTATNSAGTTLAEGRTSSVDGTYTLSVTGHTGVALLNVICDANSTMYNPETNATTVCGSDVSLNSLATIQSPGHEVTVNISPLSEIVYQRAVTLAGGVDNIADLSTDDVEEARIDIGMMFGVDPLGDDPVSGNYATIINAIHTVAEDNNLSVIELTAALAEELSDGEAEAGSEDDDLLELTAEMDDQNLSNNLVDSNGTYVPPENVGGLSDVEQAKALFDELRTQAMSVVDYDDTGSDGFLDTEAAAVEAALNEVVLDGGFIAEQVTFFLDGVSYAMENNLTTASENMSMTRSMTVLKANATTWNYTISESGSSTTWTGTVTLPAEDPENIDIVNYTTLQATINGDMPLDYDPVVATGVTDSQSFDGTVTLTKTTDGASLDMDATIASNGTSLALSSLSADIGYDVNATTDEPIFNYVKLHEMAVDGSVAGYSMTGTLTVSNYVQNPGLKLLGGTTEISESGFGINLNCSDYSTLSVSDVSFDYDGQTYSPSGSSSSIGWASYWFNDIEADVAYGDIAANLNYTASCSGVGATVMMNVNYSWSDTYTDISNSGWVPQNVSFEGSITNTATSASISGTIDAEWLNATTIDLESDEDPLVDVTVSGTLQMPSRPAMVVTLEFENNSTSNTLGASYTYGTTLINASGVFDTEMDNGAVEITTHTGIRADITVLNGDIVYGSESSVTKDGLLLGTIEDRAGVPVVSYIDGTFESLP